jgi:hypothetical protein
MAKKGLLVLVLAVLVAGGIFAQEKTADARKFWISTELGLIGAGARGEFMLGSKLSVGLNAYWNSMLFIFNEFGGGAFLRFYPSGKTFYAGLGLGFNTHSGIENFVKDGTTFSNSSKFIARQGFGVIPELGWKIDPGNTGGFFFNPHVQVPLTLGTQQYAITSGGPEETGDFGLSVGFRVALGFGWAF